MMSMMKTMVRTQIQLTEHQAAQLKRVAAERGVSMAELIRQSVDQFLQSAVYPSHQNKVQKHKELAGKYSADAADLSENHDTYLDDIFGETRQGFTLSNE